MQSDRALYGYTNALRQEHMRSAPAIDKVVYDNKLDVVQKALGLHTAVSRVQGGRLKAKKEIRVASLFKEAAPEFLRMIVVHELAHLRERTTTRPSTSSANTCCRVSPTGVRPAPVPDLARSGGEGLRSHARPSCGGLQDAQS